MLISRPIIQPGYSVNLELKWNEEIRRCEIVNVRSARNCWSVNKIPSWVEDKIAANENACPRLYDIVNAQIFYQLVRRTMLDCRAICIIIREINIFTILHLTLMDNYWNIIWFNCKYWWGKEFLNLKHSLLYVPF